MKSIGSMLPTLAPGQCEKHGEFHAIKIGGRHDCPKCGQESAERVSAEASQKVALSRREAKLRSLVYHSGIPPRFRSKTFEGFEPADDKQRRVLMIVKRYADLFDERYAAGGGMVMCGPPGTGKTHLACAIGNQIMAAGRSALFSSVLAAARRVKQTYGKGSTESEQQVLDKFYEPDLLILDEVGVQFGSEAEKLIVFEIINGRYERVLPTILMSNLPEEELGAFVGDRVIDRMREGGGVVLAFDWESRRKDIKTASRDMPAWVGQ